MKTRHLIILPLLLFSLTGMAACTPDEEEPATPGIEQPIAPNEPTTPDEPTEPVTPDDPAAPDNPDEPTTPATGKKTLVVYFSAEGHTKAVAERIVELINTDIYRIEAADPYAENPYDDSERVQNEAYNDLRPGVANLPAAETIAQYDTLFVGSPIWWHQPAMVVCTFLENYDLKDKTIIPFFTYGATTYLNESMQKIYKLTPQSNHIPATLPEDLDPDDITTPGRPDDAGINMPGNANGTEAWLRRLGLVE